jgi:dolichol-phosphate mannosyltransferase/undecaprenyl-phosphate 4-deoxy-4-formamido-L-arabinose transferase
MKELDYSIVIPVYKSGPWMDELVERIGAVMQVEARDSFELVLVNDCSPDLITWPAIKRNAEKHKWVRGVDLLYNVGQFRAMLCGMEQAQGRFILNMDDDLQHLPEELPKLIQTILADDQLLCVMGKYETKQHSAFRNMGSRLVRNIMNRLYGKPSEIQTTSFRIMRRELASAIMAYRTAKPQMGPLIVSLTKKIENISVQHAPRPQGSSGYNLWSLLSATFDSIINASTAPLRFFSVIGFLCSGASVFLMLFFLLRWLTGGIGVAGYTSQILLISFFGGMTLAGIGVLGEYVARVIAEVTGPERFCVKESVGVDHE